MNYQKIKKQAEEFFAQGNYELALNKYGLILKDNPEDKEIKICVLLCDLATENEFEAHALFDYYFIVKENGDTNIEQSIERMIASTNKENQISEFLTSLNIDAYNYLDGISYDEFEKIIAKEKDFKKSFENIVYSTKIIITNRYEMYKFLNTLIKNKFYNTAIDYIESANMVFKNDKKLVELTDKIRKLKKIEIKDK
jgi:tetratricopeptide (TPR) repeat protein